MTIKQAYDKRKQEEQNELVPADTQDTPTVIDRVVDLVKSVIPGAQKDTESDEAATDAHQEELRQIREREQAEKDAHEAAQARRRAAEAEEDPVKWIDLSLAFHGGDDQRARKLANRALTEHNPTVKMFAQQIIDYLDAHNL